MKLEISHDRLQVVDIAARNGNLELVRIFLAHGAKPTRALRYATDNGQVRLVSWLIETYPDLLSKSFFPDENVTIGTEALQQAIYCQNPPLISLLVGAGVPLNYAAKGDYPPVVEAIQFGAPWIVDYPLKIGAEKCGLEQTEEQTEDPADSDEVSDTYRGGIKVSRRTWQWVGRY